jgi:outer membrane immunogenic protein
VKHLLIAGFVALGAVSANAADLPAQTYTKAPIPTPRPIYDWSGLYIGMNAGGGRNDNCWNMNGYNVPVFSPTGTSTFIGVSGVTGLSEGCSNGTGAVVGGQIGYRYQINSWVFGIEAQGDWSDLNSSFTSTALSGLNTTLARFPGGAASLINTSKVDGIGMFTGQIGYSLGPILWYIKGGAAITDNKYSGGASASLGTASIGLTDAGSAVKFGEVVGIGLEYMFASGWSVGAEYNHLFMGSQNVGLAYTGNTVNVIGLKAGNIVGIPSRNESMSGDIDVATVRLNYSFGAR